MASQCTASSITSGYFKIQTCHFSFKCFLLLPKILSLRTNQLFLFTYPQVWRRLFTTFDFEGTWLLNATFEASPPISYIIPLIFVNPDLHPISGSLASYSLFKDELLSTDR